MDIDLKRGDSLTGYDASHPITIEEDDNEIDFGNH